MFKRIRNNLFFLWSLLLVTLSVGVMDAGSAPRSGDDVRGVQQTLLDLGYWPGPIDGNLGSRTQSAIRQYQRDEDLRATGRLDAETVRRIEQARGTRDADMVKFRGMDANNDSVISRQEYRGNDRSFANHDWNDDGVLSGEEVRPGAHRPARRAKGESEGGGVQEHRKETGRGGGEGSHGMKKGNPDPSGKGFGKSVKKPRSTESDRGNRERR